MKRLLLNQWICRFLQHNKQACRSRAPSCWFTSGRPPAGLPPAGLRQRAKRVCVANRCRYLIVTSDSWTMEQWSHYGEQYLQRMGQSDTFKCMRANVRPCSTLYCWTAWCGKGTQAQRMMDATGLPQVSTGDMLRAAVKAQTAVSYETKKYMDAGLSWSSHHRFDWRSLERRWCKDSVMFDGFPRTVPQAGSCANRWCINRPCNRCEQLLSGSVGATIAEIAEQSIDTFNPYRNVICVCGSFSEKRRADDTEETVKTNRCVSSLTSPLAITIRIVYSCWRG